MLIYLVLPAITNTISIVMFAFVLQPTF